MTNQIKIKKLDQAVKQTRYKTSFLIKWYAITRLAGLKNLIDWNDYYNIK